jgi:DnaJ-class molecular chaperone
VLALIILALAGAGGGSWWYVNAHVRPTRTCPKCEGEKYVPTPFGRGRTFRKCPKCDGEGRVLTWAARQRLKHGGQITRRQLKHGGRRVL